MNEDTVKEMIGEIVEKESQVIDLQSRKAELIDKLAPAQAKLANDIDDLEREFEGNNKEVVDQIQNLSSNIRELEETIRNEALTVYSKAGIKKVSENVSVAVRSSLDITDNNLALEWCIAKQMALTFDKKQLVKILDALPVPPFWFVKTETSFTKLSKNLTASKPASKTVSKPKNILSDDDIPF